MYRLATKPIEKNRIKETANVNSLRHIQSGVRGLVTFCYSLTSWTAELWSVTLNGHAWV